MAKNNHVGNMNPRMQPKASTVGTVKDLADKKHISYAGFKGECYPGNNDNTTLGMRNKSPQKNISGNLNLGKMEKRAYSRYEGEFGEVITHANYGSSYMGDGMHYEEEK